MEVISIERDISENGDKGAYAIVRLTDEDLDILDSMTHYAYHTFTGGVSHAMEDGDKDEYEYMMNVIDGLALLVGSGEIEVE